MFFDAAIAGRGEVQRAPTVRLQPLARSRLRSIKRDPGVP